MNAKTNNVKTSFLDFEQPIAELEAKIEELRYVQDDSALDISEEIDRLQQKNKTLTKDIYAKLTAWQISQERGIRSDRIPWITFAAFLRISRNCMATALLPTTLPL